jgi:hypothetical protein
LFVSVREGVELAIHIELETILHDKAVGYSTVVKYLGSASLRGADVTQRDWDDAFDVDLVGQIILQALTFQPFPPIRQLSGLIPLSKSTGYRHLSESLRLISQRTRRGPNKLSGIEKEARVKNSENLCSYCCQRSINHGGAL